MTGICPAGIALLRLLSSLPPAKNLQIVLFGSAPLQLTLEPGFASADIGHSFLRKSFPKREGVSRGDFTFQSADSFREMLMFADDSQPELLMAIADAGLEQGMAEVYIQCCWEGIFAPARVGGSVLQRSSKAATN